MNFVGLDFLRNMKKYFVKNKPRSHRQRNRNNIFCHFLLYIADILNNGFNGVVYGYNYNGSSNRKSVAHGFGFFSEKQVSSFKKYRWEPLGLGVIESIKVESPEDIEKIRSAFIEKYEMNSKLRSCTLEEAKKLLKRISPKYVHNFCAFIHSINGLDNASYFDLFAIREGEYCDRSTCEIPNVSILYNNMKIHGCMSKKDKEKLVEAGYPLVEIA